jgi:hypothetical protein
MFRHWFGKCKLALRFAMRNPWQILAALWPALGANLQILWWQFRGKKVLCLYVDHAVYLPFVTPIWKEFSTEQFEDVRIVVLGRPHALKQLKAELSNYQPTAAMFLSSWAGAFLLNYDLFLTTHPTSIVPLVPRGQRLCIFHGLPAKGGAFAEHQWRFLDGAFLLGPLHERLFEELRNNSPAAQRLIGYRVGYPKSDQLITGASDRTKNRETFRRDPEAPTVLYAPSWEEHGSLRTCGVQIAEQLRTAGFNVLVKLHPMSYYPTSELLATGGIDWSRAFDKLEGPGFYHAKGGDVGPLLAAADVLVTDISSVALEGILVDLPFVVIDTPRVFDEILPQLHGVHPQEARNDLRYNCGREAGLLIGELDELLPAVERSLKFPAERAAERLRIRSELLYHPGQAASVAADLIGSLLTRQVAQGSGPKVLEAKSLQTSFKPGMDSV